MKTHKKNVLSPVPSVRGAGGRSCTSFVATGTGTGTVYWLDFIQIRLAAPESCAPSRVGVCSVLFLNSDRTRGHRTSLLHFTYSYTPAEQNDPRNSTLR